MSSDWMTADVSGCDAHGGWAHELELHGSTQIGGRYTSPWVIQSTSVTVKCLLGGVVCSVKYLGALNCRRLPPTTTLTSWARRYSRLYNFSQAFKPFLYNFLSCLPCTRIFYANFDSLPLSNRALTLANRNGKKVSCNAVARYCCVFLCPHPHGCRALECCVRPTQN